LSDKSKQVGELTVEEFQTITTNLVLDQFQKFIEDKGLDEIDKRHLILPEKEAEMKQMEGGEKLHTILIAMKNDSVGELLKPQAKAADPMIEGTDASGGYLVPAVTRAEILRLIPTYSQARAYMRNLPFPKTTDTINIPQKNAGASVAYVNEASQIADSKPTLQVIQLVAKKLAGIVTFSNEFLNDSTVEIQRYVISLFAEAIGTAEDAQFFQGTGSPFTGIFNVTDVTGSNYGKKVESTVAALEAQDFLDLAYGVDQRYVNGGAFYMHRTLAAVVRGLEDSAGNPIWLNNNTGFGSILGYPVRLIENAPTAAVATASMPYVLFGNLQNSFIADKADMSIKASEEATVDGVSLYEYDLAGIRVTKRGGFHKGLVASYGVIHLAA
jgi:HK97 family phage major capsid protein